MVKIDPDGYKVAGIFLVLAVLTFLCYCFTNHVVALLVFWIIFVIFLGFESVDHD